ncbi:hypothetical protein KSD_77240 [Ktedonobacter sp. SOSP1-85]|uniref:hypothetical protein n=1 Tax=Ktedonobacter sp. SOSP1-85 TaxID=2778367 RepID=UPI001914E361|nr:hypothetical protein [Ktedonobacter sp. SOSP1-85]GHO79953.1 hypothetical protein KSD_77240 [Ktedonobacter sp. SOSP1-85]
MNFGNERDASYWSLKGGYEGLVSECEMLADNIATLLREINEEFEALAYRSEHPDEFPEWLNEWWEAYLNLDQRFSLLDQGVKERLNRQDRRLAELDQERVALVQRWGAETAEHRGWLEMQRGDLPGARQALKLRLDEAKLQLDELKRQSQSDK